MPLILPFSGKGKKVNTKTKLTAKEISKRRLGELNKIPMSDRTLSKAWREVSDKYKK